MERPPAGPARGLLILHHGRGTDEHDLLPLADVLDPARVWHVASPQAPLALPGWPGRHWYVVPTVGYPDPETFGASVKLLGEFHDQTLERTAIPPERMVLGGFSMGAVMSYALGLDGSRPAPAGILGLSGFVPTVEGWSPSLYDRTGTKVFIAHGRRDPTIGVEFARRARALLEGAVELEYHETDAGHYVDPAYLPSALGWLERAVPAPSDAGD